MSMVKELKKAGATVDAFTELSLTPSGKILKRLKANPELLKQIPDLVKFAEHAIFEREEELVLYLLENGLDPNARGKQGVLMYQLPFNLISANVLDQFLARGGDPNLPYQQGYPTTITQKIQELVEHYPPWAAHLASLVAAGEKTGPLPPAPWPKEKA